MDGRSESRGLSGSGRFWKCWIKPVSRKQDFRVGQVLGHPHIRKAGWFQAENPAGQTLKDGFKSTLVAGIAPIINFSTDISIQTAN